jgi:hypothetical protein
MKMKGATTLSDDDRRVLRQWNGLGLGGSWPDLGNRPALLQPKSERGQVQMARGKDRVPRAAPVPWAAAREMGAKS